MPVSSHPKIYDSIGHGYRDFRKPDPRIAAKIRNAIGDARRVCNIGAGTGSYEPEDCEVVAVEPSEEMIAQRTNDHSVVCCTAEKLPFADGQFDVAMAVLTLHHWVDPIAGLSEMKRVAQRQVILTFDTRVANEFWLVRDYMPEAQGFDEKRTISIDTIVGELDAKNIEVVEIPHDCIDGFQGAYWRRPDEYLKPEVRSAISSFAQLPNDLVEKVVNQLSIDLTSGAWAKRYSEWMSKETADLGYRLIST